MKTPVDRRAYFGRGRPAGDEATAVPSWEIDNTEHSMLLSAHGC